MRRLVRYAAGVVVALFGSAAQAQDGAPVVVDVSPAASHLGADALRREIGEELHAPALAPRDPNASQAQGTVKVDVDAATNELTVSYASRAAPIWRRVPLPRDMTAARREATVLAGNLARDEAGEIAAELRKDRPPIEDQEPPPDRVELERMHAVVAHYAKVERRDAIVGGVAWMVAGAAIAGYGVYVDARGGDRIGVIALSSAAISLGVLDLLDAPTGPFGKLSRRERNESAEQFADAWAMLAKEERGERRVDGWFSIVLGTLGIGVGVLAASAEKLDGLTRVSAGVVMFTAGSYGIYRGVNALVTPGPVEAALRAHEKSSGRATTAVSSPAPRLQLGFVRGGAVAGLGGAF